MKVLLVFGGQGSEHDVSIMSARNVIEALDVAGFETQLAYISKDGKWWTVGSIDGLGESHEKFSFDEIVADVIFPIVHGKGGEDGAISAVGQLIGVPVVGCDLRASTIAWDKDLCKQILRANDISVVPSITMRRGENVSYDSATQTLESDILFVKPAREGSSIGISKVTCESEFLPACEEAFRYDDKILIEKAIIGRELECAVLGSRTAAKASEVGEVLVNASFYDYDAKYADESTTVNIPALDLPSNQSDKIKELALKAFRTIGGSGLSRIDFFLADDGTLYLNEINTMPGFTSASVYPKLWQHAGISSSELVKQLIDLAV